MIARIDLTGAARRTTDARTVLPRTCLDVGAVQDAVQAICDDVKQRGSIAVREITARLDGVDLLQARVPAVEMAAALSNLAPDVVSALSEAVLRTRRVSRAQLRAEVVVDVVPGGRVTERWVPVRRVGLYVPGGLVAYPSSVVMNVVPAQEAGVESIALASPPQKDNDGLPHPAVLAACAILGIEEVYAVGGAQAIAMFAYGTDECPRVDLVTGPGNAYVASAKRLVRGVVGIDAEAGPTEIAILADDTADPRFLAADLIAQAEHDARACCLLVTPSQSLSVAVGDEVMRQLPSATHRDRIESSLTNHSAIVLVDDLEHGLEIVDEWAAEHLEVVTRDASSWARRVRNAGAVFVGPYSPVSLGDYLAGSNHVLPTGGTSRHTGGLSVGSFQRVVHVVEYDRAALAASAPAIDALGGAEDLYSHVAAVRARVPQDN